MYTVKISVLHQNGQQDVVNVGTVTVTSSVRPSRLADRIRNGLDLGIDGVHLSGVSNVHFHRSARTGGMTILFASILDFNPARIELQDVTARVDQMATFKRPRLSARV